MQQDELRQVVLACLGSFPQRVMPEVSFTDMAELEDHLRTRVTYLVEPGERVSAWLLRPLGEVPEGGWPVILAIHQHANQFHLGKCEPAGLEGDSSYFYGLELCRRGYVVLCPDQLCFEERRPPEEQRRANDGALEGGGYERFEATRLLLNGSCLQTKYLHDLTCALDVLTALPDVNSERLGVVGHSLGGQETLWLTWYDARVKVAVSSCGFSLLQTILRDGINHNFAAYVPGFLKHGDMDTLVCALAHRPFMLTAGEHDKIFPVDGVRTIIARAQETYEREDVPERFQALIFPEGHSFPGEVKENAYAFLDRWLKE